MEKLKRTIGRIDKADFPKLLLSNIDIKVDTGAYTSALHCHSVYRKLIGDKDCLCFIPLDPKHPSYRGKEIKAFDFKQRKVKSSNGKTEKRYVVKTPISLFGHSYLTEFTLTERNEMKFPVLIGRRLLSGNFVVDTSRYNLSFKSKY